MLFRRPGGGVTPEFTELELNEVVLKVQHVRAARGQGLKINSVAPLREGGPQK